MTSTWALVLDNGTGIESSTESPALFFQTSHYFKWHRVENPTFTAF